MQSSLQLALQRWKKKSIVSSRRHSACCNLGLQRAMVLNKTLQSRVATCNGPKKSLQSLQKVEPSSAAIVRQYNFLAGGCSSVERQVAGRLQRVTHSLSNLSPDFFELATTTK